MEAVKKQLWLLGTLLAIYVAAAELALFGYDWWGHMKVNISLAVCAALLLIIHERCANLLRSRKNFVKMLLYLCGSVLLHRAMHHYVFGLWVRFIHLDLYWFLATVAYPLHEVLKSAAQYFYLEINFQVAIGKNPEEPDDEEGSFLVISMKQTERQVPVSHPQISTTAS